MEITYNEIQSKLLDDWFIDYQKFLTMWENRLSTRKWNTNEVEEILINCLTPKCKEFLILPCPVKILNEINLFVKEVNNALVFMIFNTLYKLLSKPHINQSNQFKYIHENINNLTKYNDKTKQKYDDIVEYINILKENINKHKEENKTSSIKLEEYNNKVGMLEGRLINSNKDFDIVEQKYQDDIIKYKEQFNEYQNNIKNKNEEIDFFKKQNGYY